MSMSMRLSIAPDPEPYSGEIIMEASASECIGIPCVTATGTGTHSPNGAAHTNGSHTPHTDDLPDFDNKRAKIDYFSKDVTAITDYLYVGDCCGDVCDNYFPNDFHYLKLHLLDSAEEDIVCVLYKVIDFIDVVRKTKKKVLVHCQQGVSRSTVLVIAYLMYHENSDYNTIYEFVRARRGICRPNVGFMCQLLAWRKRATLSSARPYCLYRIGPHNNRDRSLVTKWVDRVEAASLDSRTLFMLQANAPNTSDTPHALSSSSTVPAAAASLNSSPTSASSSAAHQSIIFIWVGSLCPRQHEKQYLPYLAHLIAKLQFYEHASQHVVVIRQKGREKIERAAEQARLGPSPRKHQADGHQPPSPVSASPAFSSEHISAAFHTLASAPAILAATSLSSLYPSATAREAASFYRIIGLDESDDYSRVGHDCSHPISGAILLNADLDPDYTDVPVPDVHALNEAAWKVAATPATSPTKPWIVPPIVNVKKSAEYNSVGSGEDDVVMDDTDDIAARFNRTPRTSVTSRSDSGGGSGFVSLRLPAGRLGVSADVDDDSSVGFTLPKKLFTNTNSPDRNTPRSMASSPPTITILTEKTPPRLTLGLQGIRNGGDDEECSIQPMEESSEIETVPEFVPMHDELRTPHPAASYGVLLSPSSMRASNSSQALASPYALFEFPRFDSGPLIGYSRSSLVSPSVYLLHHAPTCRLHIWLPPAGALFIPSKYEGDREAFAEDIARIFQLASAATINHVTIETAGKETQEFWNGFTQ